MVGRTVPAAFAVPKLVRTEVTFPCALVAHPTQIADAAVAALLAEAELTPKPGLVDRRGRGAHADMDLPLLRRAAEALHPWFAAFVAASRHRGEPSGQLRRELAALGRSAEADMLGRPLASTPIAGRSGRSGS